LEQDERAMSTTDFFTDKRIVADAVSIILIVGNEVTGVDPGLLDLCDKILYIPMRGEKRSLNVEVAFGVAVSALLTVDSRP
jgi:tRNA G18 (ribose-2'-O)-methylase SpoU